jgi:DNA-binding protein HU-alpha
VRKPELTDAIATQAGLSKSKASEVLNAMTDEITDAVARNDAVFLHGFGTFSQRQRKARTGKHPQTGEVMEIAASKSVAFQAAKRLKEAVNLND